MPDAIKLLIVDDEPRFLRTLKQRLELRGFAVTGVRSGRAALEAAGNTRFDLALIDLKMPGMNGRKLLEALKRVDPDLEVIMLTGHGSLRSAVECSRAGSHSYLLKPCETDVLLQALADAYLHRVQRTMQVDGERIREMLHLDAKEPPLRVLDRLHGLSRTGP
jgi:DNA-binding NtrC family response regulator